MQNEISRRTFIAGTALTGAAAGAAMMGVQQAQADDTAVIGKHTWEVKPDPITDIAETKDFDIVIVGAGISGNAAAEAAARSGASVAVIEQAGQVTVHGVDDGSIGSQFQAENGISIDPEEATKLLYRWSQQTANRNLIYQWATKSGKVFDHLSEIAAEHGFTTVRALSPTAKWDWQELDELWREYPDAVSWTDLESDMGMMTADFRMVNCHIIDTLHDEAVANGAEYFFDTHAEQLVGDAASGISGVIATDPDGKYVQFNAAKGVILATGDISGNQEMIDCWAPISNRADACYYTPAGGNHGDGILMGMWAGAAHMKAPAAPMVHPIDMGPNAALGTISFSWLAVNRNGLRYSAEMPFEPMVTNARMNQPGNVAWSIFDSDYPIYVQKQFPDTYESLLEGVQEKLDAGAEAGTSWKADTIEDLANQLGIPADKLQKTIDRYNELCDAGYDEDYGVPERFLAPVKNGPFYANSIPAAELVVIFGLHVDDNSQVCTEDDEPIPGLFAVGNCQGEFFANSYPVHCPGISHGRALTFGQLVGEALAKDTVITAND
ncbi:MAG: FAD-dependent oxidoreductase [Coriobacteriales bacterium]|nr:FAD-dependent oxidoreductase [Coriobacteriales bacterium]